MQKIRPLVPLNNKEVENSAMIQTKAAQGNLERGQIFQDCASTTQFLGIWQKSVHNLASFTQMLKRETVRPAKGKQSVG